MGRLLFAALVIWSASASADELREQSRLHYQRGREAYDRRSYQVALGEFQKAYQIVPIPDLIYNVARCQEQLGDYKNAAANYRLFLATKQEVSERVQLEEHIKEMERASIQPSPEPRAPRALSITAAPGRRTPVYRRWWLWTTLGVVVAVGVGVGVGVGLSENSGPALGFPGMTLR